MKSKIKVKTKTKLKTKLKQKKTAKPRPEKLKNIALIKSEDNPLIAPIPEHNWEAWQTFNPGVILLADKVHFLYRAVGQDAISRFGYASSDDGFSIDERLIFPVYEQRLTQPGLNYFPLASGGSFGGVEDCRPVRVGTEEVIYMTYTACDQGLGVALTSIKVDDFLKKKWCWQTPVLISPPGEVHKNWVIFPEKINGQYAILHSLSPQIMIAYRDSLVFKTGEYIQSFYDGTNNSGGWESRIRGIGPAPIKTEYGWLLLYHGLDKLDPGKYKVGVMLLDLVHPEKVLMRFHEPILEPDEILQQNGFKPGVVYASGAVVKNGQILIYYGAADSYVCLAYADFDEFMAAITAEIKPHLKYGLLKKIK